MSPNIPLRSLTTTLALALGAAATLALAAPSRALEALPLLTAYCAAWLLLPTLLLQLSPELLGLLRGALSRPATPGPRRLLWLLALPLCVGLVNLGAQALLAGRLELVEDAGRLLGAVLGVGLFWLIHRALSARASLGPAALVVASTPPLLYAFFGPLSLITPGWEGAALPPLALALGFAWALSVGDRWPRARLAAAASALVLVLVGLSPPPERIVDHRAGRAALHAAWSLTDDDGDGFSDALGGADCDDADPEVHPRALEIAGDGRDNNCRGGDLAAAPRLPVARPEPAAPRDLLLLSLDAWRADAFSPELTPNLWAYSEGGRRFTHAYAPAPFTDLSMRAIFTGWPASDFDLDGTLAGMDTTLPGTLAKLGWRTYTLNALESLGELVTLGFQFQDKNLAKVHRARGSSAPRLVKRALDLLQAPSPAPRLLWLHLIEPHHPYLSHAGFEHLGGDLVGLYKQEVAFTDASLAPLLSWLSQPEIAAQITVIIFADHGEYLGEGGRKGHDHTLYAPVTRTPLVVRDPYLTPGVVEAPVSLLDIFPTVMELLGVEGLPPRGGFSLTLPRPEGATIPLEGRTSERDEAYIGLVKGSLLLHCAERDARCELFDVDEDPRCARDLSAQRPSQLSALRGDLDRFIDTHRNLQRLKARREMWIERWKGAAPK